MDNLIKNQLSVLSNVMPSSDDTRLLSDRLVKWDKRFLRLLRNEICGWSKDPSTGAAALIARDVNIIVQVGYNGYPAGLEDDHTLDIREEKYKRIIHAEMNAILLARQPVTGCTLYVYPLSPCERCAAHIIQVGIKRVVSVVSNHECYNRWMDSTKTAGDMLSQSGIDIALYIDIDS